jgi:hypothetical protein
MSLVEVSKGRATISSGFDGLEIVIPARRNWFAVIFLLAWLGGWFFGEASAIQSLLTHGLETQGFLVFWLIGWSVGGIAAAIAWSWNVAGKEVVKVGRGMLTYQRAIGPLKLTRQYDLNHVKELRVSPLGLATSRQRNGFNTLGLPGGPIAFDYGAKTINIGSGVDEAEAKSLVEAIKHRFNV